MGWMLAGIEQLPKSGGLSKVCMRAGVRTLEGVSEMVVAERMGLGVCGLENWPRVWR